MNRTFRNVCAFSGMMAGVAFVASYAREDMAFAVLGGAIACQTALTLAAWISGADARTWPRRRILAACLPSFAAAAASLGLVIWRGFMGLHTADFLVLAGILVLQGRMFADHISGADGVGSRDLIRLLLPPSSRGAVERVRQP